MKHINAADLNLLTDAELSALIGEILKCLHGMDISDREYADALCSLNIVKRTLAARRRGGPRF